MTYFEFLRNRRVLLTGHDGFKGSWFCKVLSKLGAQVYGFSDQLSPNRKTYQTICKDVIEHQGDLRCDSELNKFFKEVKPDIAIHMAAQPLVRASYFDPKATWETNVIGTLNFLRSCDQIETLNLAAVITTDKVYENIQWEWPYRESDRLGGADPYSASKAASEILLSSHNRSFAKGRYRLLSLRGGNVIGGGDFSPDRLIPDCVRAIELGNPIEIRNPSYVRPWQHVIDCIFGYLACIRYVNLKQSYEFQSFNVGPSVDEEYTVAEVIKEVQSYFVDLKFNLSGENKFSEARQLTLDNSKLRKVVGWQPQIDFKNSIRLTCEWYLSEDKITTTDEQLKIISYEN